LLTCLRSWGTAQLRTRPIPVTKFSFTIPTGYFSPRSCNGPTVILCMCFLHFDWWLPSPRPSVGIGQIGPGIGLLGPIAFPGWAEGRLRLSTHKRSRGSDVHES
jgi:hypothetical protein